MCLRVLLLAWLFADCLLDCIDDKLVQRFSTLLGFGFPAVLCPLGWTNFNFIQFFKVFLCILFLLLRNCQNSHLLT